MANEKAIISDKYHVMHDKDKKSQFNSEELRSRNKSIISYSVKHSINMFKMNITLPIPDCYGSKSGMIKNIVH
jgi:hypothetical protein